MMLSINTCQTSNCTNSQFTYCPHCSLNICIHCLHHHYGLMKTEYRQSLMDSALQLHANRQQTIEQENEISRRLFQIRSIQYDSMEQYLVDKRDYHTKTELRTFQLSDCIEIKQKYNFMMDMHQRFHQLLNEISRLITDFQSNSYSSYLIDQTNTSSVGNDCRLSNDNSSAFEIDAPSVIAKTDAVLTIELDDDEPTTQTNSMDQSKISQDFISDKPVIHRVRKSANGMLYTKQELKNMFFTCPFTRYTLGLRRCHYQSIGVANIPCRNLRKRDICLYQHLLQHHAFNAAAAMKIVRAMAYGSDRLDQIDLFSHCSIESVLSNQVLSYMGHCPLYKPDVFGILPIHNVKLCTENHSISIPLHYHLRSVHKLSYRYATRIIEALIKHTDESTVIIKPNEIIRRRT